MYWYVKLPLWCAGVLALFGCGYLLWSHLPRDLRSHPSEPAKTVAVHQPPAPEAPKVPSVSDKGDAAAVTQAVPLPTESAVAAVGQRLLAAEAQLKQDDAIGARATAAQALESPDVRRFDPLWFRATDIISRANTLLFNTDAPAPEKVRYIIQPGDSLIKIAAKFQTTVAALERGNKLDLTRVTIYPGMAISVFSGKWSIEVLKSRFLLLVYEGDKLFKLYHVGMGRQNRTPLGTFKVNSKLREPAWTPLGGKTIPYGDARNVLGTRWLGLQPTEQTDPTLRGFGIHGTWQPETVGTAASEGCVRMKNEDVNELYDMAPMGTRVVIKDE